MQVAISLFGDVQMDREILRVTARSRNLDPAFRAIFLRMMEINSEQMRSHGERGGTPYPPDKDATVRRKARLGLDTDILFATHALFEAMSSPSSSDNEAIYNQDWAVWHITGDPATYGAVHQTGTRDGRIPARPPFRLTEADKIEFVKEIQHFIFSDLSGVSPTVRGFL